MAREDKDEIERGLDLLWSRAEPPSRGPKPGLRLGEIVQAALTIADRDGLGAVSMRRIAEALGFTTMSLYRYVPGKDELVDLMFDAAIGEPPAPGVDSGWRIELARWARANFGLHHRHTWLLQVAIRRPPVGPNHLLWLDSALRAVSGLGLQERDMVAVVLLVEHYVRGAAQIAVSMEQAAKSTGVTEADWGPRYAQIMKNAVTDGRYPALAKVVSAGVFEQIDDDADDFEFGLQCVLDGIEALISQPRRGP